MSAEGRRKKEAGREWGRFECLLEHRARGHKVQLIREARRHDLLKSACKGLGRRAQHKVLRCHGHVLRQRAKERNQKEKLRADALHTEGVLNPSPRRGRRHALSARDTRRLLAFAHESAFAISTPPPRLPVGTTPWPTHFVLCVLPVALGHAVMELWGAHLCATLDSHGPPGSSGGRAAGTLSFRGGQGTKCWRRADDLRAAEELSRCKGHCLGKTNACKTHA